MRTYIKSSEFQSRSELLIIENRLPLTDEVTVDLVYYFKNCEVPIICYKYNKPIRGAIFNFNKLVSDLNIETCTPDS